MADKGVIEAWAIKAPEWRHVKDIPLRIPVIYAVLATTEFVTISDPWISFVAIMAMWSIGTWLMLYGWKGYRRVRVQITEV